MNRCPKCGRESVVLPRTVLFDGKQRMVRTCTFNDCGFHWMTFQIVFSHDKSDRIVYDVVEYKKK